MKKNMGTTDRMLRIVAAAAIVVLYLTGTITGVAALALGVVAVALLVTSAAARCPGYVPFGISTRSERSDSIRV